MKLLLLISTLIGCPVAYGVELASWVTPRPRPVAPMPQAGPARGETEALVIVTPVRRNRPWPEATYGACTITLASRIMIG